MVVVSTPPDLKALSRTLESKHTVRPRYTVSHPRLMVRPFDKKKQQGYTAHSYSALLRKGFKMSRNAVDLLGLKELVGEDCVLTDPADLEGYSHDELASARYNRQPFAVVKPRSEDQVAQVVRYCAERGIPVTARGGGTGLSGACVPAADGMVMSMERMNRIVEVDRGNYCITAQAGATMKSLFEAASAAGMFFPPHPGDESAFVGGVIATNAGGARAVKYGTVKRFLLGLRVVLATGEVIKLGGKVMKSSTGYNLLDLMLGSEGTLGIITEVTFALLAPAGCAQTLVAPFATVSEAIASVEGIVSKGYTPCAVEFVEHSVIRCAERLLKKSWPTHDGEASLMIILDGVDEDAVLPTAQKISEILEQNSALDVLLAEHSDKQAEILEIRSMMYEALRPGTEELLDICVPRTEIGSHVYFIHELESRYEMPLPTYGHAADGNIHTHLMRTFIRDGELGEEVPGWGEKHEKIRGELYRDAIQRGGVISGEHGIGLTKRDALEANVGKTNIEVMRVIKKALDPHGILNPGKVFK